MNMTRSGRLEGARILVVEDEVIIALDIAASLEDEGAEVIGPSHTLADAMAVASKSPISAAILDMRLGSASVSPVARLLSERKIPFIFYSGQAHSDPMRSEWPASKIFSKPTPLRLLIDALVRLIGGRSELTPAAR
jgi:DNA-binding NtrC family response regulator